MLDLSINYFQLGDINEMEIVNRLTDPKTGLTLAGSVRSHHKFHDLDNRLDREPESLNHEHKSYGTKTSRVFLFIFFV